MVTAELEQSQTFYFTRDSETTKSSMRFDR